MKLTNKNIVKLVNEAFVRLEITAWEAFECYNPRYRQQELEAGACSLIIKCRYKSDPENHISQFSIFSFYRREDLQEEIDKGAVLTIKTRDRIKSLADSEIIPVFLPKV